jgi:hypothetical protein
VAAIAFAGGNEEYRARAIRSNRRLQRGLAGQANGRRRKARARVGVVRRVATQIRLANIAVESLAHSVNDVGIGLQAHSASQTVHKHTGNGRPLARQRRFFFHNRRQR